MTLVTVLLGLWLDHLLEVHREGRLTRGFGALAEALTIRLPGEGGGIGLALVVVLPAALLVGLVQWTLSGWLYGLVYLVLSVAVLLWTLGPLDVSDVLEDYIEARRVDDTERSDWFYQRFTGEPVPDAVEEEGRGIVEAVLYQVHDHVFATLFWLCLLGPAGAVLYRMAAEAALRPQPGILARPALHQSLRKVAGLLAWLPARLIAIGYVITGSFAHAVPYLRSGLAYSGGDWVTGNHWLLVNVGQRALRDDDEIGGRAPPADAEGEQRSGHPGIVAEGARRLALRTLVLWLAVLALLTLTGWIA